MADIDAGVEHGDHDPLAAAPCRIRPELRLPLPDRLPTDRLQTPKIFIRLCPASRLPLAVAVGIDEAILGQEGDLVHRIGLGGFDVRIGGESRGGGEDIGLRRQIESVEMMKRRSRGRLRSPCRAPGKAESLRAPRRLVRRAQLLHRRHRSF
jgi:hypothetical protein